jgi:hypothetical protein
MKKSNMQASPKTQPTGNPTTRRYWANPGGDFGLRNGSFVRESKYGLAQYMNGDFMGIIATVPVGFTEVDTAHAEKLIPRCCNPNPPVLPRRGRLSRKSNL